jgi:hypothetical protein
MNVVTPAVAVSREDEKWHWELSWAAWLQKMETEELPREHAQWSRSLLEGMSREEFDGLFLQGAWRHGARFERYMQTTRGQCVTTSYPCGAQVRRVSDAELAHSFCRIMWVGLGGVVCV